MRTVRDALAMNIGKQIIKNSGGRDDNVRDNLVLQEVLLIEIIMLFIMLDEKRGDSIRYEKDDEPNAINRAKFNECAVPSP